MPGLKVIYRKCRKKDLLLAVRLVGKSHNALRRRVGLPPIRRRITRTPHWFLHLLETDPETHKCAWAGDKIVGFAGAVIRGRQWYLSFLFVHPRYQGRGIGKTLLERVWREGHGMSHSLATFAYNPQAIGLYSKFGMAPLSALPMMQADPKELKLSEGSGLEISTVCRRHDLAWMNRLEKEIRGYTRLREWHYWLKDKDHKLYLFRDRGRLVGYSLIGFDYQIAPAGAISNEYLSKVVLESVKSVHPGKDRKVTLWCPPQNIALYQTLVGRGFRISEVELFMSDRDYADWQRYVPATLSVF